MYLEPDLVKLSYSHDSFSFLDQKEPRSELLIRLRLSVFSELYDELVELNRRLSDYDKKIKMNEDCKRIQKLRGVGPIIATAIIAATPQPSIFKNGREFVAWLGLVPKQHSTGGKERKLGISKRGDTYLRKQLIHGCIYGVKTNDLILG